LKETYEGCEVVAVAVDVGQPDDLSGVEAKALASGASTCHVIDAREEFVREYAYPTLRAGAIYERKYLLGTSMARPVIAKHQVEVALLEGCDALAHGCTGKGNDQVRFELTYQTLAPQLAVIAPWRSWHIRSREDAIAYAAEKGVPVQATAAKIYSPRRQPLAPLPRGWHPGRPLGRAPCRRLRLDRRPGRRSGRGRLRHRRV
jgi:argininosuccinate synthase